MTGAFSHLYDYKVKASFKVIRWLQSQKGGHWKRRRLATQHKCWRRRDSATKPIRSSNPSANWLIHVPLQMCLSARWNADGGTQRREDGGGFGAYKDTDDAYRREGDEVRRRGGVWRGRGGLPLSQPRGEGQLAEDSSRIDMRCGGMSMAAWGTMFQSINARCLLMSIWGKRWQGDGNWEGSEAKPER